MILSQLIYIFKDRDDDVIKKNNFVFEIEAEMLLFIINFRLLASSL